MAARRGRRGRAVREIGWRGGAGASAGTITRRAGGGEIVGVGVGVGVREDREGKQAPPSFRAGSILFRARLFSVGAWWDPSSFFVGDD